MLRKHAVIFLLSACLSALRAQGAEALPILNLDTLSDEHKKCVDDMRVTLNAALEDKKTGGGILILTFDELYAPLNGEQRLFFDALRQLKAEDFTSHSTHFNTSTEGVEWIHLNDQRIRKEGKEVALDPQILPKEVWLAYQAMNEAMQKDIGKRLLVESAYRSPAYQLYLWIYYLPKHDYSLRETKRFLALPGQSEHQSPERQAIDFINEEGVNGEDRPEEFENLPEYKWLMEHAYEYGFILSYARGYDWAFEPWHWHYSREWAEKGKKKRSEK